MPGREAEINADAKLNLPKLAVGKFKLMFSKWKSCEALEELPSRSGWGKKLN